MPTTLRIHAALFTVAFLFSVNYVISKLGMREFAPLTFAWLRVAGSAFVLMLLARNEPPLAREDRGRVALYGLLGVVINQACFLGGLSFTTVQVAAILITTIPVFTHAVAIAVGSERASANRIGGIALAGAGALLVVGGEGVAGTGKSLFGAVLIVVNCFSYALYLVLSKPMMTRLSPRRVVARMFSVGTVLLFPIAAVPLWREEWRAVTARGWISLLLVIAGPTVGAYLVNAWTLRHADSSLVAAYTYVQPVLATILGAVVFGEEIRLIVLFAAALIFGGVYLASRAESAPSARM